MMKRFFYLFRQLDGRISVGFLSSDCHDTAVQELTFNDVKVLFLSTYYTPLSRVLYKYFKHMIEVNNDGLQSLLNKYKDWTVTKPYLYFCRSDNQFMVSNDMVFGSYGMELIGYVPDKAVQDLLIQNDI